MIQEEALRIRTKFRLTLKPFLDMLEHKKNEMDADDWAVVVLQLETSIINNPEQYLGRELPTANILVRIIKELFEEFLQNQLSIVD